MTAEPSVKPQTRTGARRNRERLAPVMLDRLSHDRREENNFDALRLFAALLVLFAHSWDITDGLEPIIHASWGDVGVIIFFSISGFLVTRSWFYAPRLGVFAFKRALRLLPGLFVALLVTTLILGPLVSNLGPGAYFGNSGTKAYLLTNATLQTSYLLPGVFVHNIYPYAVNGSLWTLPLEVKAYTVLAIVGFIATRLRAPGLIVVVAVYAVIAMFEGGRLWLPGGAHYAAFLTNVQIPATVVATAKSPAGVGSFTLFCLYPAAFGIGASLFVMRRWIPIVWPLALIAFAAIVFVIATQVNNPVDYTIVFAAPYLILWIAYRTHGLIHLPRRWGDYSYGIYVYAFPVQQTVSMVFNARGWAMFFIAVGPTCVLAVLSWHLVERPVLRLKSIVGGSTAEVAVPSPEPHRTPTPAVN